MKTEHTDARVTKFSTSSICTQRSLAAMEYRGAYGAGGAPPPTRAYQGAYDGRPPAMPYDSRGSYDGWRRNSDDGGVGKSKDPLMQVLNWIKSQNSAVKGLLGLGLATALLLILWRTITDHDTLFVLAESAHFLGIGVLAYKLHKKKSVAGLSLQTQLLTAIFLGVRLFCSFMMEYDIHTVLDLLTLLATLGVLYCMLLSKMRVTYQKEQDLTKAYFVLIPCLLLALVAKPTTSHYLGFRVMWAFCVYLEAVSVYPQLRMMQKAKVVERFTAHYVFALGLSRFLSCAHWILQILEGNKYLLQALGSGLWPVMVLLSEVVQTFVLAGFCYHYVKSYAEGSGIVRLPAGIV